MRDDVKKLIFNFIKIIHPIRGIGSNGAGSEVSQVFQKIFTKENLEKNSLSHNLFLNTLK